MLELQAVSTFNVDRPVESLRAEQDERIRVHDHMRSPIRWLPSAEHRNLLLLGVGIALLVVAIMDILRFGLFAGSYGAP